MKRFLALAAAVTLAGCNDPATMAVLNQAATQILADGKLAPSAAPAASAGPGLADILKTIPTGLGAGDPTADEKQLYELLMAYRAEKGLPRIPLSRSLTIVAQTHAKDLQKHPPDEDKGCNMHSWSSDGPWKAVCYTDDHAQAAGMWSKPSELTRYAGSGYEIAYGAWGSPVDPQGALEGWQGSPGHNQVIVNAATWSDNTWKAVGCGITENYAVTWFGEEADPTP